MQTCNRDEEMGGVRLLKHTGFSGCDYKRRKKRKPRGLHTCADAANNHLHKSYYILFSEAFNIYMHIYMYIYPPLLVFFFTFLAGAMDIILPTPTMRAFSSYRSPCAQQHATTRKCHLSAQRSISSFRRADGWCWAANQPKQRWKNKYIKEREEKGPVSTEIIILKSKRREGKEEKKTTRGILNYKHTQTGGGGCARTGWIISFSVVEIFFSFLLVFVVDSLLSFSIVSGVCRNG